MKLIKSLVLTSLMLTVIFITGCEKGTTSLIEPANTGVQLSKFFLPPGATFVSAKLFIWNYQYNGKLVNVHRVTEPWQEYDVTFNSFNGAYSSNIEGFLSDDVVGNLLIFQACFKVG